MVIFRGVMSMIQFSHIKQQQGVYMPLGISEMKAKHKPRILLVEDELIVQKVHRIKLEKLGCIVDVATNGIKALELYKNGYNLILLDCGLPDISGIDVGKIIRQYEQEHSLIHVPMVMVTAYIDDEKLQQECNNAGINELITKPIKEDVQWETLLKRWLRKDLIL